MARLKNPELYKLHLKRDGKTVIFQIQPKTLSQQIFVFSPISTTRNQCVWNHVYQKNICLERKNKACLCEVINVFILDHTSRTLTVVLWRIVSIIRYIKIADVKYFYELWMVLPFQASLSCLRNVNFKIQIEPLSLPCIFLNKYNSVF